MYLASCSTPDVASDSLRTSSIDKKSSDKTTKKMDIRAIYMISSIKVKPFLRCLVDC